MIRQNMRRKAKFLKENDVECGAREGRENSAAKSSCPGKNGPTIFIWENKEVFGLGRKNTLRSWKKKVQELERLYRQLEETAEDSKQECTEHSVMDGASSEAFRMLHRHRPPNIMKYRNEIFYEIAPPLL